MSDGGLVTSLVPPQPPPPPAPQPPMVQRFAFPAQTGKEKQRPCSTFYSAAERKWRGGSVTADSSQSGDRTIVTQADSEPEGAGKRGQGAGP